LFEIFGGIFSGFTDKIDQTEIEIEVEMESSFLNTAAS
jgi:hypothetical protein